MEGSYFPLSSALGRLASFGPLNTRENPSIVDTGTPSPVNVSVSKETSIPKLTRAGFYFDKEKRVIRCYRCKSEFNHWNGESPVAVHRILNPECPYLKGDSLDDENNDSLSNRQRYNSGVCRVLFPTECEPVDSGSCTDSQQPAEVELNPDFPDRTPSADEILEEGDVGQPSPRTRGSETPTNNNNILLNFFQSPWKNHVEEYSGKIIRPKVGDISYMCFESFRLLTFPDPTDPVCGEWARNGFMWYERNRVRCVYCGGCADFNDSPVKLIHEEISPRGRYCCPVVSGLDVGDVSRDLEKHVREKINHQNNQRNQRNTGYPVLHPQYKSLEERLSSFKYWPKSCSIEKNELINAGFFYTGASDKVVCFCCGVAVRDWEPEADVLKQHALISPTCLFLLYKYGENLINSSKHIQYQNKDLLTTTGQLIQKKGDNCPMIKHVKYV